MLIFFKKHMLLFFRSSDLNMLFSRRNMLKELLHTYLPGMLLIMLKKAIYALEYAASVHGDRALESSSIAFSDHFIIHKGYQAL